MARTLKMTESPLHVLQPMLFNAALGQLLADSASPTVNVSRITTDSPNQDQHPRVLGRQSVLLFSTSGLRSYFVFLGIFLWVVFCHAQASLPDEFNPHASGPVDALVVQADGRILVGGNFTTLGGQPCNNLARLHMNGTLDRSFRPDAAARSLSRVYSLAVQADGKILVGGYSTQQVAHTRICLKRLNSDGTLDSGFKSGADGAVYSLVIQADGKILVGGSFAILGGESRSRIGRLNPDGSIDSGFNPGATGGLYPSFESMVYSLAVQADGKILVGGSFTSLGGQQRGSIGRLNPDGSLDTGFNPSTSADGFSSRAVRSLAVQPDGKILVGGKFRYLNDQKRPHLGRLNPDGSLDGEFNPSPGDWVSSLALQANGKILVGGFFAGLGGERRNYLGRLNPDGSLDAAFNPGIGPHASYVSSLAVQMDGKILIGGTFSLLGGQTRNCIGRLNNNEPATQILSFDGTEIVWKRAGSSPEVWRTSFEMRTNGSAWVSVHEGERVNGGWNTSGSGLPGHANIRARGFIACGQYNGSCSFVETSIGPPMFALQPESRTEAATTTATFLTFLNGTEPLVYQWWKDGHPLTDGAKVSGSASATLTISNVTQSDAARYFVVVTNLLGSITSQVAVLKVVNPVVPDSLNTTANGSVYCLAVQADGKVLLGGHFTELDGQKHLYLGRLNAAGTLDSSFNPEANGPVNALAVQADGKILVGGSFSSLGGQTRLNLGRLNAIGTLDSSFHPGANNPVNALAVQADGRILVGGSFTSLGLQARNRIGRLNPDGSIDPGFNPEAQSYGYHPSVTSLAIQADGKILVGGSFTRLGGQSRYSLGRLNFDGSLDSEFNPDGAGGDFANVNSLAIQADGKIVVGGCFTVLNGQPRNGLGRLNPGGSLDQAFNPEVGPASSSVSSLALQADGKILVGGAFSTLGGQAHYRIGRLNSDGSLDQAFNPEVGPASSSVFCLAIQPDGKILVGGTFSTLGGQSRNRIGRLNNTELAIQSLTLESSAITWLRSATSPEVQRATFDYSSNGLDWTTLGAGSRLPNGWQLSDVRIPHGSMLRVRGHTPGGGGSPSSWFVEFLGGFPYLLIQPSNGTHYAGATVTSSVVAGGLEPLAFQWQKDGANLSDDGRISGAISSSLTISNTQLLDAGHYTVIVTNAYGSVTSQVAKLTVLHPGQTFSLADYYYPAHAGNEWVYDSRYQNTWTTRVRLEAAHQLQTFYTGCPGPVSTYQRPANAFLFDQGDGSWTNYMSPGNDYGYLGTHHDDGAPPVRFDPGFVFSNRMSFGQTIRLTNDVYTGGVCIGQGAFAVRLIDLADVTVPYGTFRDCLHLEINYTIGGKTRQEENWWAMGVGPVKWTHGEPGVTLLEVNELRSASLVRPPWILTPPASLTATAGSAVNLSVEATGDQPLGYQWRKNGLDLADGARLSGSSSANLVISNLQLADAGHYTVEVTNPYGSVTSQAAVLTLILPLRFTLDPAVSNGVIHGKLTGPAHSSVVLQSSDNLIDWVGISTNAIPAEGLPLGWPILTNRQQFFRARIAP